ncbi:MAG: Asp-tRNA(Asn)/Glu-tRNA(Gln) amidotransferase subunit GatA [Ruminococcaceae bacterium]|nr:Asp-tRNA(Asn)/Glu-tRNA(Gln) amidotransferase subunit GatA [Oscillospiraceae bacterium]
MKSFLNRSISEHAEALNKKEYSSVELTREFLENIKHDIGAYITVCEEKALSDAKRADELLAKEKNISCLCGIPFAAKDNLCTNGIRTTAASLMLENYIPPYDATVISRLYSHGAILLGKTNMDEFAMGSSTETSALKITRNPIDKSRVSGGSSGGSAAAVAADEAVFSLGSDTGGSVRQPAAFCGLVGLCPTYSRISRYGLIAFASSLDRVGIITRTVCDNALVLSAIAGHDPLDMTSAKLSDSFDIEENISLHGLRIGIVNELLFGGASNDVKAAVLKAAEHFKSLGAELVEISLPSANEALEAYYVISSAEASSNLARLDGVRYGTRAKDTDNLEELLCRSRSEGFGSEVKRRIMLGSFALSKGYLEEYYKKACAIRERVKADFEESFKNCDVLLTPTAPTSAFLLGKERKDPTEIYAGDICTVPSSIAGLPALSIPCGKDESGLPFGMQLIAPAFCEALLYKVGYAYERTETQNEIN